MHQDILNDDSLTFAEKIIGIRAEGSEKVHHPGEITVLPADMAMAQDSTGPLAIKVFGEMGVPKVWDPSRIHLVIDHTFPAADEKVANLHHMMRDFAKKHGVRLVEGSISHQHLLENHIVPGMVLFGADSHKVNLTGQFKKGIYARDVISHFIGMVGEDGGNYKSIEWKGHAVKALSMSSRACISNNSMECGCKLSVFEVDPATQEYFRSVNRKPMYEVHAGTKARYKDEYDIDLDKLEPKVAEPGNVDKVKAVEEVEGTPIDEAFIGSSTNGRYEDLVVAAKVLKGHKINSGTRCIVTPASRHVFEQAIKEGLAEIFLQSGAVFTNATCGACVGTHLGVLGENEVCISSSPRNYVGRMGAITAKIYLSSPATAAASAIEGKIADPRRYL